MRNTVLIAIAAALSYNASIVVILALPYTSSATMISSEAAEHHRNDEGVRGGTKTNQQQQEERWMQTDGDGVEMVTAQEAPTTMEMPLPPSTTTTAAAAAAAAVVGSTTESPEEQQARENIEYSPIYNTRMKTCKGYETEGLRGYTTLDDLRDDLQLYFYDMNGYSYHRTAADMITEEPTVHPSASPSMSYKPSSARSEVPSFIPTGHPVSGQNPADISGGDEEGEDGGVSIAPFPVPALRTAAPSRSPTLSPVGPDENQLILGEGSGRKRMRGGSIHGGEEVGSDGRRRLQEVAGATTTPATEPVQEYVEVMNENGQAELDEVIITDLDNNTSGEVSTMGQSTMIDTQELQEEEPGIHFHICPNTNFQFNNLYVAQLKLHPLVVESPVQQPLTLACLEENTCTFSMGDYHVVFNNNGLEEDNLDQSSMDQQHGTITVSGIKFEEAGESSIVMNDPQGKIVFDKCKWQNNDGEAIIVAGKYSSKNLEKAYYGENDYMLPPGKENPFALTEPTNIPPETTEVPMDFLFGSGSTPGPMTTDFSMGETTEIPGDDGMDDGMDDGRMRLLQGWNVKSLIVIRDSTFTVSVHLFFIFAVCFFAFVLCLV